MNKATIYLIRGSDLEPYGFDYDENLPTIAQLESAYPGITTYMKRGDIIEDINESGYRSQGIYFYNGNEIIHQNTEFDDYGSPPKEFKVLTEFPPCYWQQTFKCQGKLPVNDKYLYDVKGRSNFYWHSDYPPISLDLESLDIINKINDAILHNRNYIIVEHGNQYSIIKLNSPFDEHFYVMLSEESIPFDHTPYINKGLTFGYYLETAY